MMEGKEIICMHRAMQEVITNVPFNRISDLKARPVWGLEPFPWERAEGTDTLSHIVFCQK